MVLHSIIRARLRLIASAYLVFSFASPSLSQNWEQVDAIDSVFVASVAGHGDLLMAATDSVVFRSTDGGSTWHRSPSTPPSELLSVLSDINGTMYLGTIGDGAFASADSGRSWMPMNDGLDGFARRIVAFALRNDTLFAGTDGAGVFMRPLSLSTPWVPFSAGLTQLGTVSLVVFDDALYAIVGSLVFRHEPENAAWETLPSDSLGVAIPQTMIAHQGTLYLGTNDGVFKRSPFDAHWTQADIRAFPLASIQTFAAAGDRIFAGLNYRTEHWIWSTENGGLTWDVRTHEFALLTQLVAHRDRMWAARSDGLWWFPLGSWTSVDGHEETMSQPQQPSLSEPFPNPFNPSTSIRYALTQRVTVRLTVHDLLGREIRTLVDEEQSPGEKELKWDASDLTSGVYFVRLSTGGFMQSRRIVLLR